MLKVGDHFPSFAYIKIDGSSSDTGHLFHNKWTAVVWLRHFGCRFYQEAKVKLPRLSLSLQENDTSLACVVQGTFEETRAYWAFSDIEVIPDPEKSSYRLIGLGRTTLLKILFPGKELKKRREEATSLGCSMDKQGTRERHSDILQLPGAALVGPDGTLKWIHRGGHTGDLDLSEDFAKVISEVKTKT